MRKLNYVVTCFMGERRLKTVSEPEYFIRKHLNFLQDHKSDVARVTLILNTDNSEEEDRLRKVVSEFEPYYTELKIMVRENKGFSYAAWNHVMNDCIENNEGFTEYFLLEDDYVPATVDFIEKYESKIDDRTGYVCQRISNLTLGNLFNFPIHPGVSCGLMPAKPAEEAYKEFGSVLVTFETNTYDAESLDAQTYFLDNITGKLKYTLKDSSSFSSVIFVHVFPKSVRGWSLMEYSDPSLPRVIEPVIEWEIFNKGENE